MVVGSLPRPIVDPLTRRSLLQFWINLNFRSGKLATIVG